MFQNMFGFKVPFPKFAKLINNIFFAILTVTLITVTWINQDAP